MGLSFDYLPPRGVDISRETWQEDEDDERELTITVYGEDSIRETIEFLDHNLIPYREA